MRLQNKVAVVTAAGQGIGRATTIAMLKEGAIVWATDIDAVALDALPSHPNLRTAVVDVLNWSEVEALFAQLSVVDVLFNCAGFVHDGSVLDANDEQWALGINLNVRSQFWTIKLALPKMLERGHGSIINMTSISSSVKGIARRFVYGTTKAAVIGLTKSIAADFVAKGIRCNAIAPGTIDTPSLHQRISMNADPQQALTTFMARQPMGRLGTADEVAPLVVFLASDESVLVTGQTYIVDGGATI